MSYKKRNDSKEFYIGKANDYSLYRPSYAQELFDFLKEKYLLNRSSVIVELGARTGKFSKIISKDVFQVYAVEPNLDMLKQGMDNCKNTNIKYVKGSAENTTLNSNCADFVFAVQSFHWFDKEKTKEEVKRILKADGTFAIVWNNWEDDENEFSKKYFKYISDWKIKLTGNKYQHKNENDKKNFFKDGNYDTYDFRHSKEYTLDMLNGLTKSLSYAPNEQEDYYAEFINGVDKIFKEYSKNNVVKFDFHTEMFIGKV